MKKLVQMAAVALMVVGLSGCQNQKKTGASFNDRGNRAQNVSQQTANSVRPSAVVYGVDSNNQWLSHNYWMSMITRLVSPSISSEYLMDVSQDGTGSTGVFLGARLCSGPNGPLNSRALLVLHVYDTYGAIPIYLKNPQGYVQNGSFDITFRDSYGSVRITGSIVSTTSGQKASGWVVFDTRQNRNGDSDSSGQQLLGQYYYDNLNELFSCY